MSLSKQITQEVVNAPGGVIYLGVQTNVEAQELVRIELAARTCYKSEDRITEDSAIKLFRQLMDRKHYAMIRFGERTVILSNDCWKIIRELLIEHRQLQFWRWEQLSDKILVTANLQAWLFLAKIVDWELENYSILHFSSKYKIVAVTLSEIFQKWPIFGEYICSSLSNALDDSSNGFPWEEVGIEELLPFARYRGLWRHCFRVVTDRAISHEIVRHTTLSYGQESTRYVSYKDYEELPIWIPEHLKNHASREVFKNILRYCLNTYNTWCNTESQQRLVPGDARNFLPHCLRTELVISGYLDESNIGSEFNQGFSHFIDMRSDIAAHPGIQVVANRIKQEFQA